MTMSISHAAFAAVRYDVRSTIGLLSDSCAFCYLFIYYQLLYTWYSTRGSRPINHFFDIHV